MSEHILKHVKQPTDMSCVLACIAMVVGCTAEYVIETAHTILPEYVPECGINMRQEHLILDHYNVRYNQLYTPDLVFGNLYLATVPSLNKKAHNHRIIIDLQYENGEYNQRVLDPNKGTGRKYYEYDDLRGYSELTLIFL